MDWPGPSVASPNCEFSPSFCRQHRVAGARQPPRSQRVHQHAEPSPGRPRPDRGARPAGRSGDVHERRRRHLRELRARGHRRRRHEHGSTGTTRTRSPRRRRSCRSSSSELRVLHPGRGESTETTEASDSTDVSETTDAVGHHRGCRARPSRPTRPTPPMTHRRRRDHRSLTRGQVGAGSGRRGRGGLLLGRRDADGGAGSASFGQRRRDTIDSVRSSFIATSSSWAGRAIDRAVGDHPVDDLLTELGAHDRERPVVVLADAAGGDVGVLGGEVGAVLAALAGPLRGTP